MTAKTYNFEAETDQVLDLLTNAIYSNKEIFLRELISNASDAIEKARVISLTDTNYLWDWEKFEIKIIPNKETKTIEIIDNWIWMTREEVIKNIWTIAKSWTKEFIKKLKEEKKQNSLIWQFWVWFYSSFIVSDKVILETNTWSEEKSTIWESDWKWSYTIKDWTKKDRWTTITLYLKEGEEEFLEEWKLRELIKKYSNYIQTPIMMKEITSDENKDKERKFEQINEAKAIWNKNKSEIKQEEYEEFYKNITYDYNKPLSHIHISTEWVINYKSILFIPSEKNIFGIQGYPNQDYGPKLFIQNVLIIEKAKELLPVWLRFVSWVVETNDLPLNISREMLQSNPTLDKIQKSLTKKVLERLKYELDNNENYDKFLENYSQILKEWIYYSPENREKIAEVLKFSTMNESKNITLDKYIENNKNDKKEIYYITAKNKQEALSNPYLEQFRDKKIDVLLLVDPIDEWVVSSLSEYKEYKLVSVLNADLSTKEEKEKKEKEIKEKQKEFKDLFELIKNTIWSDKIEEVKISDKLKDSIWALKTKEGWLTPQMEKIMKSMWQQVPPSKRILELNINNPIVKKMLSEFNKDMKSEKLKDMIMYTYEQAVLLEWWELSDVKWFINRINKFIK